METTSSSRVGAQAPEATAPAPAAEPAQDPQNAPQQAQQPQQPQEGAAPVPAARRTVEGYL
ncbi:hypothetical protein ACFXJJ_30620, partial [Streptomyces sp. NPDC059233]